MTTGLESARDDVNVGRLRADSLRANAGPAVLDMIRRRDGISRTELARRTGLSAQAISKIVARLVDTGLVRESGRQSVRVGKARTRLSIVPRSRFALGINLDRNGAVAALVNLAGEVESTAQADFGDHPPPEEAVDMIGQAVDTLLQERECTSSRVIGCGLGMVGPLDHRRGVVTAPNNFFGWHDVPLAKMVAGRIGTSVVLDKSTNMAMLAEHWRMPRPGWTVVIYVGTGIGAGLMLDGEVYRGVHSDAGEFGHMVLDPAGPRCVCGRHGCIEVLTSPAAAVDRYLRRTGRFDRPATETPAWNRQTRDQLRQIAGLAAGGESDARGALRDSGRLLGIGATNLVALLDIDEIILAGPMLDLVGPEYVAGVQEGLALGRTVPYRGARISVSHYLDSDTIALGAALLVLGAVGV